jgi:hypothetical protein
MNFSKTGLIFLALILLVTQAKAENFHFFKYQSFGKAFISDIYSSHIKIQSGFINDLGEHYYKANYKKRPFFEAQMGGDISLISYYKNFEGGRLKCASVGMASFNLLLDALETTTSMVINTDYWMGLELRCLLYHHSIEKTGLRNIGLVLVPLYHESTHVGDEYTIEGLQKSDEFYRVNVSYEAWKLSLIINDPDTLKGNILSARIGIQSVWFAKDGYYQYDILETSGQELLPSQRIFSYWVQLNWRRTQGLVASKEIHQINSLEIHNRVKFGYFPDDPERRVWNFNAYLGWEYQSDNERKVGAYLHAYYGINPHGQFRYIDNFYFLGLAFTVS